MKGNYSGHAIRGRGLVGLDCGNGACRDGGPAAGRKSGLTGLYVGLNGIIGHAQDNFRGIGGLRRGLAEDRHNLMERSSWVAGGTHGADRSDRPGIGRRARGLRLAYGELRM